MQDTSVGDILAPGIPSTPPVTDTSVAGALDLPVAPAPVRYRAFDDAASAREIMHENILKAVQGRYPIENQRHKLALENVAWRGADKYSLAEQKKSIMRGESLDRLLEGDWVLYDKSNGQEIERRRTTVAHVPFLTNRGTFIYRGNEYTVGNQMRLKPGVYTRVKENGILEAHVNVRPGTGSSFRVYMEPDTGIFRMGLGQSELKLYPILKAMGVSDDQLEKHWGRELLMRNVEAEDPRAVSRAFNKLVGNLAEEPPENLDVESDTEKEAADGTEGLAEPRLSSGNKQADSSGERGTRLPGGDTEVGSGRAEHETDNPGQGEGSPDSRGHSKRAASAAGVATASKWVAPVFGAAVVPLGASLSNYGYNLASLARQVRPEIKKTKEIAKDFKERFGVEAVKDYEKFDPQGDTYKQWRMLRRNKFLEPYVQAGHEGLTSPVGKKTEGIDIIRRLRQMTGTWKDYQTRHYGAFTDSPRSAFKMLATEGIEETQVKGMGNALDNLMADYDRLADLHGPYEGLRRLYNEPWAKVNLSSPASVKKFVDEFGNDKLEDVKKKQALLFYASKSKLYAPKWYGLLTSGSSVAGHAMGLGGAALAGYGGFKSIGGLLKLLKRGEAAVQDPAVPSVISTPSTADVVKAQEGDVISDVVAGANPFSTKVDVMGVPFKPESRKEELKRVIPAVIGKGLVGAVVVPSMVRSGVELARGLAKQGPYAPILGRMHAGLTGALLGSVIPIATLARAVRVGHVLRGIEKGKTIPAGKLQMLARQLGEAPLRSSQATMKAIPELMAGNMITPELAREARRELFEPNTTILLNAALGGIITGYAGYGAYARGKQLREAFEQVYGKELPPEVAAVIMDPKKLKALSKMRREALMAERRSTVVDRMKERHAAREKARLEHKSE